MPYDSARRQRQRLNEAALHNQVCAHWYADIAMTARDAGYHANAIACQRRAARAAETAQRYVAKLLATFDA